MIAGLVCFGHSPGTVSNGGFGYFLIVIIHSLSKKGFLLGFSPMIKEITTANGILRDLYITSRLLNNLLPLKPLPGCLPRPISLPVFLSVPLLSESALKPDFECLMSIFGTIFQFGVTHVRDAILDNF